MPPQLALLICISLILYLFWIDREKNDGVSGAIWIPYLWMFLAGSRSFSEWLNLGVPLRGTDVYSEGSPLDAAVFLLLMVAGVAILHQRRLRWAALFRDNTWVWLFFAYCAISVFWSDDPFVSMKRWIRALGNVAMALVILTEQRPIAAIGVVLRRLAFVLLPLSVLFIKFYPELGRGYHAIGSVMYTGVATQKNGLGQICLLTGIYFAWDLCLAHSKWFDLKGPRRHNHYLIYLVLIPMVVWLFYMANSATALACMIIVVGLFIVGRHSVIAQKPRRLVSLAFTGIVIFGILEFATDFTTMLVTMLGRTPDLTTRVPLWEALLSLVENPLIGTGYEIFWSGKRMLQIWYEYGPIIQAHNGYLDIYLNLGVIGLSLLLASITAGAIKVVKLLDHDYVNGMMKMAFLVIVVFYNWSEATFKPLSNLFILILFSILEVPSQVTTSEDVSDGS
jgi:exopolysaccharide production protein ExoQ